MTTPCPWCGEPVAIRRVGANWRKFCSRDCKWAMHNSLRKWAWAQFKSGRVTAAELRDHGSDMPDAER